MQGIEEAAAQGLLVKINTILVPGVNETEVESIARESAARGASFMNLIPLLPVKGTPSRARASPARKS